MEGCVVGVAYFTIIEFVGLVVVVVIAVWLFDVEQKRACQRESL